MYVYSYRIEHSLDTYILYNSIQEEHTATQNICAAVNIHRRALESVFIHCYFFNLFAKIEIFVLISISTVTSYYTIFSLSVIFYY